MNSFIDSLGRIIFVVSTLYTTFKFLFWLTVICIVAWWAIHNWTYIITSKDNLLKMFISTTTKAADAQKTANEIIEMIQTISASTPDLIKNVNSQIEIIKNLDMTKQIAALEEMKIKIDLMDIKIDEIKKKLDI